MIGLQGMELNIYASFNHHIYNLTCSGVEGLFSNLNNLSVFT